MTRFVDDPRDRRLRAALVASVGGFLFGFDWVVIAGAKPFYESSFEIQQSPLIQGSLMAAALAGCLIGSLVAGAVSDRCGRKPLLMASAIGFLCSAVGTALASGVIAFAIFRWIGGLAIGVTASTSPLYIAEVSRQEHRGRMVSVHQLMIVIGILAAQIANWFFASYADTTRAFLPNAALDHDDCWRAMFAMEALPAALFLWWLRGVPESIAANTENGVAASRAASSGPVVVDGGASNDGGVLQTTRNQRPGDDEAPGGEPSATAGPGSLGLLMVGVSLAVFQQWCGVNVLFSYAENVFSAAGYELDAVMWSMVCTGIINLVFTLLAMLIVDRVGRRPLLVVGAIGLAATFVGLGMAYRNVTHPTWVLAAVMAAIALYAMTLAPVTWIVISEIFPGPRRGWRMGLCVASLWSANALLTFFYPSLEASFGIGKMFFAFAALCAFAGGLMLLALPETRANRLATGDP